MSFNGEFRGVILDYADVANLYLNKRYSEGNVYRGVFPGWDNEVAPVVRTEFPLR